jgi:arylsulfatase A-like enzyme
VPVEMSGRSFLDVLLSSASGRVDPSRSWTACGLEWHGEFEPVNLAGRAIRDERYQYIVNYSDGPRRVLSSEKRRPDAEYEKTAETGSEISLIEQHPEHPAVRRFVPLLASPRPREELYDCQEDPWELNNLADSPEHAAIKARLKTQLEAYQRKTKDPRITGDMAIFEQTRAFVQERKQRGYKDE